ncbi:MAG: cardiolipin synthase [Firmicutes bacterium HGW-Firmicutes-11]|nr:MAG: cardiolipin synthase [Firmicutes bacterium HGW-Firmicutes-11]
MYTIQWSSLYYMPVIVYVASFVIALAIIFIERKNPSASLAWIMVLFMLPGIGILFYLLLSQNIARQKIFRLTNYENRVLTDALEEQIHQIRTNEYKFVNASEKRWVDMIMLHQNYSRSFLTQNNQLTILTDGHHKFETLLTDISNAKTSINIMYYIIKNDEAGKRLIEALRKKAAEGVEVRLMIDAMGGRQISPRHLVQFREAGGKYAFFFPPKFKYLNMKLNYRNHRKMVIIDDAIGYLGGFNIGNEYLGKNKKFGYWRDTHLRLTGSCVQDLNARFLLDWRFASRENITLSSVYYCEVADTGNTGIQIVSSGPDSQQSEVKHGYLKMIASAKKNIYIQTPYFVPDSSIMESLRSAIFSGVDVRIMIPNMPDHMFVYWATYSYVGELLSIGAKIYIYNGGFLHAKNICVDGEVASVGSANFDIRSFRLNFEVNAFIYDEEEVYKLESIFQSDMSVSDELTMETYEKRSLFIKFKESIGRLLSDLL